jgi:hypothetical protein
MKRMVALGTLLALMACSDNSQSLDPLLNRCVQTIECRDTTCDNALGICVQPRATRPYDYRVKVTPTEVTDAGVLAPATTARATLGDAGELPALVVPRAVFATGQVLAADGTTAVEAELVFRPRDDNSIGGGRSVFTRPGPMGQAYEAELEPGRSYDVMVYPRGADSQQYPPRAFELATGADDLVQLFPYDVPLEPLEGQILDENGLPARAGLRIKTRYRDRLLASSSLGIIDAKGGFTLRVPQSVLAAPAEHELVLDLSSDDVPQNVQIAFDLTKWPAGGKWTMPVVPNAVPVIGTVETEFRTEVNAQMTFISDFVLPPGNMDQREKDWCQLRRSTLPRGTFRCSAYVSANVELDLAVPPGEPPGQVVKVRLLPGDYKVVISPSGDARALQRLALDISPVDISSQSPGAVVAANFPLTFVTEYQFLVRSPGDRPMPSVDVAASALGLQGDLDEIALYNRSDLRSTSYDGNARLAIDVGFYDLMATPPEGSGYAWVLGYNRRIAPSEQVDPNKVELREYKLRPQLPVLVSGSAVTAARRPVAAANVDAYALVPDLAGGPDRAVRIAHSTTDREGKFTLQMPPRIGLPEDDEVRDGGVADAGRDAQR